jgi:hypothetical protein
VPKINELGAHGCAHNPKVVGSNPAHATINFCRVWPQSFRETTSIVTEQIPFTFGAVVPPRSISAGNHSDFFHMLCEYGTGCGNILVKQAPDGQLSPWLRSSAFRPVAIPRTRDSPKEGGPLSPSALAHAA